MASCSVCCAARYHEPIAGRLVDIAAAVADVREIEGEVALDQLGHLLRWQGLGEVGVPLDIEEQHREILRFLRQ
jgi:hypothetical protein